jgi:diguanylate cyclase (GGDEF)-like protein/PAS domain S-box-containing protein
VPDTFDEIVAMVHPDDHHLFLEPNPDPGAVDRFDVEFRFTRTRGGEAWVGCKGSFVRDDAGELMGIRGTMVNLTEQRQVEIRRVAAEARYRETIEAANDAFVGADAEGDICEWNAAATRMFGWTAEEVRGRSVMELLVPEHRRERCALGWADWADLLDTGRSLPERREMTGCHRDGGTFPVEISLVDGIDGNDRSAGVRAFVRDISARRAQEERLAELAVTDALTGLPDRTVLLDRLARGIGAVDDGRSCVAVLFVDVDHFKAVNDELGHDAGDQLLISVAQRLRSAVRPSDTVARMGGDEFAIVCEDLAGPEAAAVVAERILTALAAPLPLGRHQHRVAVSIGVAAAYDSSVAPEALLREADQAMYRAKNGGGGNVAFAEG